MGGGDLNTKKSWHPNTMKNQERVWKAEQAAAEEKKRILELQREREVENDRTQLNELALRNFGANNATGDNRLHWMYDKPDKQVQQEDYLLGKAIGKSSDDNASQHAIPAVSRRVVGSSMTSIGDDTQVDLARKLREDPLLMVKERERAARAALLNNPLQRKKLTELLRKEREQKQNKVKNKTKKKSKDLDNVLAAKLNALAGTKGIDITNLLNSDDSSDSSSSDEKSKKKKKKKKSKKSKKKNQSSESENDIRSDPKKNKNKKLRSQSKQSFSSDEDSEYETNKKKKRQESSRSKGESHTEKNKNEQKMEQTFSKSTSNRRVLSVSPQRKDSKQMRPSRRDSRSLSPHTPQKKPYHRKQSPEGEGQRHGSSYYSQKKDYQRTSSPSRGRRRRMSSDSPQRKDDRRQSPRRNELKRKSPEYQRKDTKKKSYEDQRNRRQGISEEEKAVRLAEMAAAGMEREVERGQRVAKQRAEDSKDSQHTRVPRALENEARALPESLESRIHSNRHYIQRDRKHMNEHFARR